MSRKFWTGTGAAALVLGSAFLAANAAKPKPEAPGAGPTTKPVKLTKPWSELKDLSAEQNAKIHAIHEKALAEMDVIKTKEHDDCLAVLSDAQKKELDSAIAADKKEAAERRSAEHAPAAGATTKPAEKKSS